MLIAEEALQQFRAGLAQLRRKGTAPPWRPPALEEFAENEIAMGFDPSLSSLGWIILHVVLPASDVVPPMVSVINRGAIRPRTELTGYLGMWERARQINEELQGLIGYWPVHHYACEPPLVGSGRRKESSEVAGSLVAIACGREGFHALPARHVSSVLAGNPRHDKGEIRDAVARYIPGSDGRQWNQDQRDAAAAALTLLWDIRQARLAAAAAAK